MHVYLCAYSYHCHSSIRGWFEHANYNLCTVCDSSCFFSPGFSPSVDFLWIILSLSNTFRVSIIFMRPLMMVTHGKDGGFAHLQRKTMLALILQNTMAFGNSMRAKAGLLSQNRSSIMDSVANLKHLYHLLTGTSLLSFNMRLSTQMFSSAVGHTLSFCLHLMD